MTTEILREIRNIYGNFDYKLFNTYWYGWEADFGCISKTGYIYEVEVKVSRSDYKADFKKDKHRFLDGHRTDVLLDTKRAHYYSDREELLIKMVNEILVGDGPTSDVSFCKPSSRIPNKFYYACPENLIKVDEVPRYAGLYYYNPNPIYPKQKIIEVKPAPFLHKEKHDKTTLLLNKYYWQHNNMARDFHMIDYAIRQHLTEDGKRLYEKLKRKLSV